MKFSPELVAIASTIIALLLTLWLQPLLVNQMPAALFYIAIAVSSWYGGFQPGIFAIGLSILVFDYYFIPPIYQLQITSLKGILQLALFGSVSLIITLLSTNLQHSRQKIEQLNSELIAKTSERLQVALNAAQMGMWDWNLETGEITWSPEHEKLFGLAHGSFDGQYQTFDQCLYPEDRDELNRIIQQTIKHHIPYKHEFRVVWADGSIHWIEGRGQVFYNEKGEPVRMLGTVMEISERKQAQLLLEQQLEQQRLVMEMTNRIRASLHLPEILQTTVNEVRQFLQTDRVMIFQFFTNFQGKVVVESCGENWRSILSTEIYDPCFSKNYIEPFKQGLVTAKSDIYTDGISECHLQLLCSFQVRANLVVPILQDEELWGLLIAHHCETSRQWKDSEIDLLKQIASGMSIALKQSALLETLQAELNERQQAQQTLAKELLRTQTLFDTSFDGIVIMDKEGNVLDANPRFAEMLGYTPEEILRLMVFDWDAQFTCEELQQLMKKVMINHHGILETRHRRKDGSVYDVEISYNVVEWEGEILRFCACRDISLRKQAEKTLKRSRDQLEQQVQERTQELWKINNKLQQREREFRTLVENTPDIITRHDRQYRYLYVNPACRQQSGIPSVEYLGKTPSELSYPKEITDFWEASLENVFTTGKIRIDEFQITNFNEAKIYQTYVVPEFGDGESVESVITIARDITELRKAEQSARQLAEELQRSNQELEQFAYIASHDLQEPLRAVASFAQMLAKRYRGKLDGKADTYIQFIIDGATRMQQMIQDLLSYSRVGRAELKLQSVDCNALLKQVKKDLQFSIAETQAIITADSLPTITADANQLRNLLQNLINNSLKYRSETFPQIHISAKKNQREVQPENLTQLSVPPEIKIQEEWLFSIQDNGIGIEPQYAERIFGIFQRLHTSDEYPGTGLGLAICRKILERHEGRIWVESHPNQGAIFFFTIPIINYTQHDCTFS